MGVSAAIQGASTVGAAVIAANASKHATDTNLQMYNQTRSDLLPYMTTGNSALSQLASLWGLGPGGNGAPNADAAMSALQNFPGYKFGLSQGETAGDQAAASKGLVLSGGQLEAQRKFGTDYAMQQAWQPYVSQLNNLANLGEDAGARTGAIGTTLAGNAATAQLAGGSAAAGGILGLGNTLAGSFGQSSSYLGLNQAGWSALGQGSGFGSEVAAGDPLAGLF